MNFFKASCLAGLVAVATLLNALPVHASGALSQQVINPTGGTSASDGIRIFIGSNSQVQVVGWSELTAPGVPGIYPQMFGGCTTPGCTTYSTPTTGSMFNTVALRIEPIGGGPARVIYANNNNTMPGRINFTQSSQSASITGTGTPLDPFTVITTLNPPVPDDVITVRLIDTYIFPNPFFSRRIELTGLPTTEQVKLYWYIDTYLAGGDSGRGTSQTSIGNTSGIPDFIGVTKPGVLQGIQNTSGMPLWDHYYSGSYSTPSNTLIPGTTGDLTDLINTSTTDNGIAVQWNVPPGQTSFTVATGQTYGGSALVSESYVPDNIFTNQISSLQFTFQNYDDGTALTGLGSTYTLPANVVIASPFTLSNGCTGSTVSTTGGVVAISAVSLPVAINPTTPSTCTVSVNVTSAVPGVYTNTLTPTSAGLTAAQSGSDTLTVTAGGGGGGSGTAVPVPLLPPLALLVLAGMLGWVGIRQRAS